jgi:arabinan endo-1,5-alpha-L-arabinosidase
MEFTGSNPAFLKFPTCALANGREARFTGKLWLLQALAPVMNRYWLLACSLSVLAPTWLGCSSSSGSDTPGQSGSAGASAVAGANSVAGSAATPASSGAAGNTGTAGGAGTAFGGSGNGGVGGTSAGSAGSTSAGGGSTAGTGGLGGGGSTSTAGASSGGAGAATGGSTGTAGSGTAGSAGTAGAAATYPTPTTAHRAIGVHDPSMIQVGNTYYLFATGGKLSFRSSTDLATWSNAGTIFTALPAWIATELGTTITDLWAPDISYQNGVYRVYYAGSVFGSNHSVIGLVTNTTLDQNNAAYKWVDQGLVIESNKTGSTDNWNAIDPNFIRDESGNAWVVFGSFWSGIKLRRVDATTGKVSTADTTLYSLANYTNGIEAASIAFHNGYYYLFVSYDACCKGVDSTYRTMVGRSAAITGPYSDNTGKAMLQGNALQMLATDGRYIGPGGGTAFRDGSLYYYVYHYYDGQANGASFLMMRPIAWTSDDWPSFSAPLWE